MNQPNIVEIKDLKTVIGETTIHTDINLSIKQGEVLGLVGGSGSGKTTLLREMLGLIKPTAGSIRVFDKELINATPTQLLTIQQRWGVLFQQNALFSSLTLLENVAFPLNEFSHLDHDLIKELARLKILLSGLPIDAIHKYPAELSGGMQKRAGLARAIVMDPELIFLDEPSSGLDPNTAASLDDLIIDLQQTMGLTIVMITHDLDSLWRTTSRVAFLGEGTILNAAPMKELINDPHPLIKKFFKGPRGRMVEENYGK